MHSTAAAAAPPARRSAKIGTQSDFRRALRITVLLLFALSSWLGYRAFYGPPARYMESLDSLDKLNWEAQHIGAELWRMKQLPPWRGMDFNYPRLAGVLLLVRAPGVVEPVFYMPMADWWWRFRKPITYSILEAIRDGSLAGNIRPGTIVHYGLEDSDVFYHEGEEGEDSPIGSGVRSLVSKFPNLFWVHWNPTVIDKVRGLIGPRMVPIPDYEAIYGAETLLESVLTANLGFSSKPNQVHQRLAAHQPPASHSASSPTPPLSWMNRKQRVVWRGATTAMLQRYEDSDRFRAVKAFLHMPDGEKTLADVKFNAAVQRVKEKDLLPGMLGSSLAPKDMMQARVVLDIDGNANAWSSLRWKLAGGSTVVKVDPRRFVQWYYPMLEHGVNIWIVDPPGLDEGASSDLVRDSVALASGSLRRGGQPVGELVARRAHDFAREHLTPVAALRELHNILSNLEPYRDGERPWTIVKKSDGKSAGEDG